MDILEDMGGCALIAIIAAVILMLVIGVAVVALGVAIPNLLG